SALAILRTVDRTRLSERNLPYYALLMTQAQVKTDTPVDSDSLISIAYAKYADAWRGDKGIRSSFYMGEVFFNQEKLRDAMRHYLSAYEESKRLGNDYWRAKSAERIADLFFNVYNYPEATQYRKEAIEAYERSGHNVCKLHAESRLARINEHDGKIIGQLQTQDSLFTLGYQQANLDSILIDLSDGNRMSPQIAVLKMYGLDLLSDWLQAMLPDREKLEGAIYIGNFLRQENRMTESDSILIDANKYVASDEDRIKILYALYQNARNEERKTKALELADSIFHYQETVTNRILMETLDGVHSEYYTDLSIKSEKKSRIYLGASMVIIFIVCLVAFGVWRILILRNRTQSAELEASIGSMINMKAIADMQRLKIENIKRTHENAIEQKDLILESLFKDKWRTLNKLCEEYYGSAGSQKMKEAVSKRIESEIKKIGSEEGLVAIEKEVDKYLDGIVEKLKQEYPSLKHKDIAFCSLLFAGFSTKAICFILDIQSGNFYVRKGRLIKKITESQSLHKDEFLSRLK
ncbi:MAG: hypothetical protein K2L00_03380, partial [Muribaculaceae bacterium]|nr:hypothetical protein [Muribaculaceae bacterium]